MTDKKSKPAFPNYEKGGLTKRELYAAMIFAAYSNHHSDIESLVKKAVEEADALIDALENKK